MKKLLNAVLKFFCMVFVLLLCNGTVSYARDNAYVCTLFNEQTQMYQTIVMFSGDELEKGRITALYFDEVDLSNIGKEICGVGIPIEQSNWVVNGTNAAQGGIAGTLDGEVDDVSVSYNYILSAESNADMKEITEKVFAMLNGAKLYDGEKTSEKAQAPLTFPASTNNATEADINRAYEVAEILGNSLRDALLFLNDGNSYADNAKANYTTRMAYYLLNGSESITNAYGSKYEVKWNEDKGTVTLTYVGKYTKLLKGSDTAWDLSNDSFVPATTKKSQTFRYKVRKGYVDETRQSPSKDKVLDGSDQANKLNIDTSKVEDYYAETKKKVGGDVYEVSWYHMVLEANIHRDMGITYDNYGDIYTISDVEEGLVGILRSMLYSLKSTLGCYSADDLIFNRGAMGSSVYVNGIYPTLWNDNVVTFNIISVVIAMSVVIISVMLMFGKNNFATASTGSRYAIMEGVKDQIVVVALLFFSLPIIFILTKAVALFVNIFGVIAQGTGKEISSMVPVSNYSTLTGVLISLAIFAIEAYINVIYIIRRYILVFLIAFAPLFLVCYGFGQKGKTIATAYVEELVGNILIQPVHAMVFAFYLTTVNGLRGIEALVLLASIIPLTNLYKKILGSGGIATSKLADKITSKGTAMGTAGIGVGANLVGNTISGVGAIAGSGLNIAGSAVSTMSPSGAIGNVTNTVGRTVSAAGDVLKNGSGAVGEIVSASGNKVGAAVNVGAAIALESGGENLNKANVMGNKAVDKKGLAMQRFATTGNTVSRYIGGFKSSPTGGGLGKPSFTPSSNFDNFASSTDRNVDGTTVFYDKKEGILEKQSAFGDWKSVDVVTDTNTGLRNVTGEIDRPTKAEDRKRQIAFDELAKAYRAAEGPNRYAKGSNVVSKYQQNFQATLDKYGLANFVPSAGGESATVTMVDTGFGGANVSINNGNLQFTKK